MESLATGQTDSNRKGDHFCLVDKHACLEPWDADGFRSFRFPRVSVELNAKVRRRFEVPVRTIGAIRTLIPARQSKNVTIDRSVPMAIPARMMTDQLEPR